jgi:hypothetical protein
MQHPRLWSIDSFRVSENYALGVSERGAGVKAAERSGKGPHGWPGTAPGCGRAERGSVSRPKGARGRGRDPSGGVGSRGARLDSRDE